MKLFLWGIQWTSAIIEVFMCYCFVILIEDKNLAWNKQYTWLWSISMGTMLAVNRSYSGGLVSWLMLAFQSVVIFISLIRKLKENKLFCLSIIVAYNVCSAFFQLFFAFWMMAVFQDVKMKQIYVIYGIYKVGCSLLSSITLFGTYIIVLRYVKKNKSDLTLFRKSFYIYDVAGMLLIIITQIQVETYGKNRSVEGAFFLLLLIGFTLFIFLGSIKSVGIQTELRLLEYKNKLMEDNYKAIRNMYQNVAYTYHDMKNHLIVLENYCKSGEVEKAIIYIEKIQKPILQIREYVNSGNEIMDIIVNFKLTEAKKNGIEVEVIMDKMEEVGIDEIDLCAIFSNLLDNAIEACEKIIQGEKWIRIYVKALGEMTFINISNTFVSNNKSLGEASDERRVSRRGVHGYGRKSVESKVEKYGGEIKWEIKDNIYTTAITFFDTKNR